MDSSGCHSGSVGYDRPGVSGVDGTTGVSTGGSSVELPGPGAGGVVVSEGTGVTVTEGVGVSGVGVMVSGGVDVVVSEGVGVVVSVSFTFSKSIP